MATDETKAGRPDGRWKIGETERWTAYLNEDQNLLGRCYLMLKRDETDVTKLTPEEMAELWDGTRRLKSALDRLWEPDHYNYAFLMNQTPQVHWHVIPRYRARREYAGGTFVDPEFGGHYNVGPAKHLETGGYDAVLTALRRGWG